MDLKNMEEKGRNREGTDEMRNEKGWKSERGKREGGRQRDSFGSGGPFVKLLCVYKSGLEGSPHDVTLRTL